MNDQHPVAADAGDVAQVRDIVRRARSSFTAGMKVLPAERRDAMFAVYAFCREVDDIADEGADLDTKRRELDAWRRHIGNLYAGRPEGPITRALAPAIADYGLREADFQAVIDGMAMDAEPRVRIADRTGLALYCDRVAGAVGRLSVRIFGMDPARGDDLAKALGEALQLTNILRDLYEDAQRDRLYLPADLLGEHGIDGTDDAFAVLRHPELPSVCADLAGTAEERFRQSRALIAAAPRRQVLPAALMLHAYARILVKLRREGWRDVERRVSLSRPEKLWVVMRHGIFGG